MADKQMRIADFGMRSDFAEKQGNRTWQKYCYQFSFAKTDRQMVRRRWKLRGSYQSSVTSYQLSGPGQFRFQFFCRYIFLLKI